MSDTAVNETDTLSSFLLDGDAPRLASAAPPAATAPSFADAPSHGAAGSPLLPAPSLDQVPVLTALTGPSLPTAVPEPTLPTEGSSTADAEPAHPMAHLMPMKQPSESSAWAAELRAAKKRKGRRIKIGLTVGFVAVAALLGPPLGSWLWNAINEAGDTSPEPAATVAPAPTTAVGVIEISVPAPSATNAPTGLAGLPGAAADAVDATNATGAVAPAPTVAP